MLQMAQLSFNDSESILMEEFMNFYNFTLGLMVMISVMVAFLMMDLVFNKMICINYYEFMHLELIWTAIPMVILIFIGLPSLNILYYTDESTLKESTTLKVTGHQWYWTYSLPLWGNISSSENIDSFLIPTNSLKPNMFRLLDTSSSISLPSKTHIQVMVSSADVLHSWTIPSLGVKIDAIPGRINMTNFISTMEGVNYGQCSEICGSYHSYMPIKINLLKLNHFLKSSL